MLTNPSSVVNPIIRRTPRGERQLTRDVLHIEGKRESVGDDDGKAHTFYTLREQEQILEQIAHRPVTSAA